MDDVLAQLAAEACYCGEHLRVPQPSRCISLFCSTWRRAHSILSTTSLHPPSGVMPAAAPFWGDACSRAFKQPREARLGAIDGSCGVTVSCAAVVVPSRASRAPTDHVFRR